MNISHKLKICENNSLTKIYYLNGCKHIGQLQSNLSAMATLGTEESGPVVERWLLKRGWNKMHLSFDFIAHVSSLCQCSSRPQCSLAVNLWQVYLGRYVRRDVCASATEIPYWRHKICLESGQELWLVNIVVSLF